MSTGKKKHDGELKTLILNEVKRLPNSFQKKYENLSLSQNPLSNHKDIQEITEKIIEAITQKVKISYHNTEYGTYLENKCKKAADLGRNLKNE